MEILQIILPAILVLITAYILLQKMLGNEENRRNYELRKEKASLITPVKLRAYERLMLLLERTTPSTLLVTVAKPGMTSKDLQSELLVTIRQEFSHNLSQQIYVTDEVWNYIRSTQESLLRLVNGCAAQCNPTDSAAALAELIINTYTSSEQPPTEIAIEKLKAEVRRFI